MKKYEIKFLTIALVSLLCSIPTLSLADPKANQQELLKRLMQSDSYKELTNTNPSKPLKSERLILPDDDIDIPTDNDDKAKKDNINYIGQRLLSLAEKDPKVMPLPNSLSAEFKECRFIQTEMITTFVDECIIEDAAPTYKLRNDESFQIIATTPRCCLLGVKISPNQLTFEQTLDLFDGLKGVEKRSTSCKNIEGRDDFGNYNEFFTIYKNKKAMFSIKESTGGGSGGQNKSTTIYYGQTTINCQEIARYDKQEMDTIRKINQQTLAQQSPPPPAPISPPVRVQKSHNQLLSTLSPNERRLAENTKTLFFCAGFLKDVWPDASRENCRGSGMVNNSKCEAFIVDSVYNDMNNSSKPQSPRFAEFMNQSQDVYFGQYSRGRSASKNRQSNNDEWFNAVSVCRKFTDDLKKSLSKQIK